MSDNLFIVSIEDALDHRHSEEFNTLEEAQRCYQNYLEVGPEGYEIGIELEKVVGDYEDFITLAEHEWFTQEEWETAHPRNDKDGVWENVDW